MLKVLIDTSPLQNANSLRGVGMYTRFLTEELEKKRSIEVRRRELQQFEKSWLPDVTHYPYFDLFFATLPVFRKGKTVVTIHDVIPLKFSKFYKPGKKGLLRFIQQRLVLQSVDAIITDSEASKKDIVQYLKVKPEKVHVTYLAGNPNIEKPHHTKVAEIKAKYSLPEKYILYVGDINYNKNLPQLIKSLKFLPDDIHLVCVGRNFTPQEIPEWKWIETQIAMSDVASRVKFIADISGDANEELSALYAAADCYVQPSLYEGFGLPILEAMQCRTPVISTQNSSLIEIGGEHVQFVKEDAESIAAGIKVVLGWTESQKTEWVRTAYEWSQKFTWKKTADQTVAVYESLSK
jgi:glycosyltransferase involved in cell wall biosynthesis